MRALDVSIDRFAHKHPKFGIPHLMNLILIGNVLVFCLDLFSNGEATNFLGLSFGSILNLELWRAVTFFFVPDNTRPLWFVVSLFFYYFLGNTMEREWGRAKFTLFYLCGAVLIFLASIVTFYWSQGMFYIVTVGPIHQTLFLAFATLYPEAQMRFYFVIPIKAKWLAALYVFMEVFEILRLSRVMLYILLPFLLPSLLAALLNYLIFFWTPLSAAVRRLFGRTRHQTSKQTINFKAAQKKAKETKGYLHKCAVCGKTDADDPNMEFRYCSKCDGYYCYCIDHINSHVHIHKD